MIRSIVSFGMSLGLFLTVGLASPLGNFKVDESLGSARVAVEGDTLLASTGKIERRWKWGGNGLVTTSLKDVATGKEWVTLSPVHESDWEYQEFTAQGTCRLVDLSARLSDDKGFTTKHIELTAEVLYQTIGVKYIVWIYPASDGFRTQLKIKRLAGFESLEECQYDETKKGMLSHYPYSEYTASSQELTGRTEYVAVDTRSLSKRGIGYYNHTQGRNRGETQILRDVPVGSGVLGWASLLALAGDSGGLVFVKESHKCVNQTGLNTGVFKIVPSGVEATGWGILPHEITSEYRGYWANWIILHSSKSEADRDLALKVFDRLRYPVDSSRDVYLMANTWGSGETKNWSQSAAREENVLVEIESQADLGLDIQQIDDGWQGWATGGKNWRPVSVLDYSTRPLKKEKGMGDGEVFDATAEKFSMYPEGWDNVREFASRMGVRLGLWCHARIPLADLKWNFDNGGFNSYKVDFINFKNYQELDTMMSKVRDFALYTDHQIRVNWDVTEHPPRIGYYFGREYGNVYLANRKTKSPAEVVYVPYLVLRDAWQVAQYANLNKFQITVQNGERCNPEVSDAYRHTPDYLVAQTLMGSPIFFQETHYYSEEARAQIKPVIAAYRKVRQEMYQGYVFPIGDLPDNRSWSGFQNHNPNTNVGYVTMFRQLESDDTAKKMGLNFVNNCRLEFTNLMDERNWTVDVGSSGEIELSIDKPSGYLFLKYEITTNDTSF